jgi:asparagine synthase (glutamine-hydrolysing)
MSSESERSVRLREVFQQALQSPAELREELLQKGHRLASKSDTEVLPHLYEEYGADFVHRLNGQFAIAVWDSKQKRLLLIRDRIGKNPLFDTVRGGVLVFWKKWLDRVEGEKLDRFIPKLATEVSTTFRQLDVALEAREAPTVDFAVLR